MSLQDDVSTMRRIPLFAPIDPAKLKLLAFTSRRLTYEPGQSIFAQGDEGDAAYVIISGDADDLVSTPDGGEVVVARVAKNGIVGEIALLGDVPRTATVRARTELEALRVMKEDFLQLLREFPNLSILMLRDLALRLASTTQELTEARRRLGQG